MVTTNHIVQKLWNLCHVLRDDGITYHQYVTELTWLLFLKMVQETNREEQLPRGYRWANLERKDGIELLTFYRKLLLHLGTQGSPRVQAIFANASTSLKEPRNLKKLVDAIDALDWYSATSEGLGDLYDGLLEKNASEKKSGAGQYFTPRPLIDAMVAVIQPQPGELVQDPAAGSAGFLIAADRYIKERTDNLFALTEKQQIFQRSWAFHGVEMVPDTHRLALMNLILHDLESDLLLGDTLSQLGSSLPKADVILTNPPFGTKRGGRLPTRDDLTFPTSSKQLAFLQHAYRGLKPGGRAAVVLPDSALFEENVGALIRADLMEKCNLHTILRLPAGIFYAQGVKTNVLFFTKGTEDTHQTDAVWVYDLRSGAPDFSRTPLTREYFADFERAFGSDPYGRSAREEQGLAGRFRRVTRSEIRSLRERLDIVLLDAEPSAVGVANHDVLSRRAGPYLEEVFKKQGLPVATYVETPEVTRIRVALRTRGRGLVLEGPSGIGKTTAVLRAVEQLGRTWTRLTPRDPLHLPEIQSLLTNKEFGMVIVDDFHRLDDGLKRALADKMKLLADDDSTLSKLVVVGISRVGDTLVSFGRDLSARVEVVRFGEHPERLVREVIRRGEEALNVSIDAAAGIAQAARGSFYLAQMLAHEACLIDGVTEAHDGPSPRRVEATLPSVRDHVTRDLSRTFFPLARRFATGPSLKREGRAPYLHLLRWLADSGGMSIRVDAEAARREHACGPVQRLVDRGLLSAFLGAEPELREVVHYERATATLSAEDPQFVFFLRALDWMAFADQVGFVGPHGAVENEWHMSYDFALSFAGEDRALAEALYERLAIDLECAVFYDFAEQHRILSAPVEGYLGPIYRSAATYVVALLGPNYPKKVWTKFEAAQFGSRFRENAVIPVFFRSAPPGMFDASAEYGGLVFDPDGDRDAQVAYIVDVLRRKIVDSRMSQRQRTPA